jgi:peptide/nickel transport system permease protein
VSGHFGKAADALIMRFVDGFRSVPTILMNLVIMMIAGPGIGTVIFSLGITTWTHYARIVRGEVLSVRQREYVLSARAVGAGNARIIFTDIMPNVMSAFIVSCTNSVASAIITESSLSFLGLGIAPPSVTWGSILSDGRSYVATAWWISTFPGIAICLAVLGIMFLGDWLRDFLDPRINANA